MNVQIIQQIERATNAVVTYEIDNEANTIYTLKKAIDGVEQSVKVAVTAAANAAKSAEDIAKIVAEHAAKDFSLIREAKNPVKESK